MVIRTVLSLKYPIKSIQPLKTSLCSQLYSPKMGQIICRMEDPATEGPAKWHFCISGTWALYNSSCTACCKLLESSVLFSPLLSNASKIINRILDINAKYAVAVLGFFLKIQIKVAQPFSQHYPKEQSWLIEWQLSWNHFCRISATPIYCVSNVSGLVAFPVLVTKRLLWQKRKICCLVLCGVCTITVCALCLCACPPFSF